MKHNFKSVWPYVTCILYKLSIFDIKLYNLSYELRYRVNSLFVSFSESSKHLIWPNLVGYGGKKLR